MSYRGAAYKGAGVDLRSASRLVDRIKPIAEKTHTKGVVTDIGLFAGMFRPDLQGISRPILVSATDGVGTKLKLAFALDKHDTIGIDLVGMNVNDIICHGAQPLFFLDYLAAGKLDIDQAEAIISGIGQGCQEAGCALLGGETAEMPGFYAPGEYDLSGFCVGLVDESNVVDGSNISIGNSIIGLASSGPHSNGYSLIRKILEDHQPDLAEDLPGTEKNIGQALLEPTIIYARTILNLLRDFDIRGMVHITGGGFYDNLPRILPKGVQAEIFFSSWPKTPIFEWLQKKGGLDWEEMLQVFNCGIGMALICPKKKTGDVLQRIKAMGHEAWMIGKISARKKQQEQVQIVF
ncbi:MAG: phosphoribosylformylglycinamidine cyclo-ligase [Desulfohalobiaceae bacterium]|nr:phosphoribosylformylglycinamidine cyclo-ligase [Desulfohalobiaceae bacterium]